MMLARDYAACHAARSTQTTCKISDGLQKSGFKLYGPLVGPIETQSSCTVAAIQSQGAHAGYTSDGCGHSTKVYS